MTVLRIARQDGAKDRRHAWIGLARERRHLITLLDELQALGVAFVSLAEGIDATTPAGDCRCTSSGP